MMPKNRRLHPGWGVIVLFSRFADLSALSKDEAVDRLSALEARVALAERRAGIGSFRWVKGEERPDWSPGLYRILGFDPAEPNSRFGLLELAHKDDREILTTAIENVRSAPGPFFLRYRAVRPDGAERHLEISGDIETDEDGTLVAVVGIVTDITARVEAEEQLRGAMDAFRVLTEEANDLICRHDTAMNVLYCSPALTRMLGYDAADMLGHSFVKIIHDDDRQDLARAHRELLRPGTSKIITMRMHHKDGRILWIESVCRSVGDPLTGRVHEIITVSRDVSVRKAAEAEINKARETAESANRTKSRFLATMSHELRTPLNAILGFSEVMKDELFGAHAVPAYRDYSNDIHSSGQHLLALINEILDLSRVEAGRYELKEDAISLSAIIQDCEHLLLLRAQKRGIAINEAIENDLPRLWADERAIRQVALNLMTNAIKFTPQGGQITIKVGWTQAGGQYFSVRDTGTGIPEHEIPIVMSSFGRGTLAQKNADEGSGLGLPIVKGLVELHGGTFTLRSKVREGTEVIVVFPPERVMNALPRFGEHETDAHAARAPHRTAA